MKVLVAEVLVLSFVLGWAVRPSAQQPRRDEFSFVGLVQLTVTPKTTMVIVSVDQDPPDGNVDFGALMELAPETSLPKPVTKHGSLHYISNRQLTIADKGAPSLVFTIPEFISTAAKSVSSPYKLVGITRIATAGAGGHEVFIQQFGKLTHMPQRPER